MVVEKPIPKKLQRENSAMRQSEFLAITCKNSKSGENHATRVIGLGFPPH